MKELIQIQTQLRAPKSQYNKFGGYAYRSCEDILNAVKPLLADTKTFITLNDEVVLIGTRYYIKATATIFNSDGQSVSVSAMACESEPLKGMTAAQTSGATSSYARKYALNGLLAIDDAKDDDTLNTHDKGTKAKAKTQAPAQDDNRADEEAAINAINAAATRAELNQVWSNIKSTNPELTAKGTAVFAAAQARGQQLPQAS